MANKRLECEKSCSRYYETGTKNGVLYVQDGGSYGVGVAWNGITAVTESPSGAEATDLYADDIKYASLRSAEKFGGTIEAYTYPDEFAKCDGSVELIPGMTIGQQARKAFGLSYVTQISNDENVDGYKLHIVYGATASPSEKSYSTINDSPEAITFSWEFETTPINVNIEGQTLKPTSLIVIDSIKAGNAAMTAITDILYGSEDADPRLPLPEEVYTILSGAAAAKG